MNKFFHIPSVLFAILLSGCFSQQLSVDRHGKKLASRLGTKESEIKFLSYGDFIAKIEIRNRKYVVKRGIIALTDSDLRLESRQHIRHLFSKELTVIPLQEMEGVSKIGSQIHIKHGEEEIVLEFDLGSSLYADAKDSETAYQWLASRGIPVYEVAEITRIGPYTRPIGLQRRRDGPPDPLYLENYYNPYRDDYDPGYYGSPIQVSPNDPDC